MVGRVNDVDPVPVESVVDEVAGLNDPPAFEVHAIEMLGTGFELASKT